LPCQQKYATTCGPINMRFITAVDGFISDVHFYHQRDCDMPGQLPPERKEIDCAWFSVLERSLSEWESQ
jgi:hypothetical protein